MKKWKKKKKKVVCLLAVLFCFTKKKNVHQKTSIYGVAENVRKRSGGILTMFFVSSKEQREVSTMVA